MTDQTTNIIAPVLVNNFTSRFGCPQFVNIDKCRQFESEISQSSCEGLVVRKSCTTLYHLASNSQEEWYKCYKD